MLRPFKLVLSSLLLITASYASEDLENPVEILPQVQSEEITLQEPLPPLTISDVINPIYKLAKRAFVTLTVEYAQDAPSYYFGSEFLDWLLCVQFWATPSEQESKKIECLAFFISENGYLLSNSLPLEGILNISARTSDGQELAVTGFGSDPRTNIAVLKVEGEHFPAVKVGKSQHLLTQQEVITVENDMSLLFSVRLDRIRHPGSAYAEPIHAEDFIQIERAASETQVGALVFNIQGEVLGIHTGHEGLVLPIHMALNAMDSVLKQ